MKCADCAYLEFDYDYLIGGVINRCKNVLKYLPPTAGGELLEHECEFFVEKSGISKWESYTDEEKEEILVEFDKMYHGDDKSFNGIRNTYTLEEAKRMYIEHLKNSDKNMK